MSKIRSRRLQCWTVVALALMLGGLLALNHGREAAAQGQRKARAPIQGLSRQPSEAASKVFLDPNDTVLLLLDHQTGLFQTVKDVPLADLRANTIALTKMAQLAGIPILTTASEPNGPNGPLMEELEPRNLGKAAQYIARQGEVSAWDNADFVKAVEATGRKTLVIAGVWTSVCVTFPALQAKADGYKVYFVTDASGDPSEMASRTTIARASQAGIIPATTNVIAGEIQRSWNRPDAAEWAAIYAQMNPNYRAAIESHQRAQEAAKTSKK